MQKKLCENKKLKNKIINHKQLKRAGEYWHSLGPGLTTGAADDDPSGIATYSQAGAKYGSQLLWLAPFTFPLMAIVQEMCARIGLVTGQGLAANIRHHYPRSVLYLCTTLLFAANTLNIGANLGAMASGVQLLAPNLPFAALVIGFASFSLVLQIFTSYANYSKYLKYLSLALFSYIFSALSINLNWQEIWYNALIPTLKFSKDQLFLVAAVLGTTISPYLFFWQTSQEVEEEILKGETTIQERQLQVTPKAIGHMRFDVWTGMLFSNVVMFFIIAASGAALYTQGITDITSAAQAALALRPFAGNFAYLLFTLGIIGTGLLSIPVLAGSASYALSESFGWKYGLYRKLKQAYAFYGVLMLAMILGLLLNFVNLDPIKALIYSAVGNAIVSPVVLLLIVGLSRNKKIMGNYANRPLVSWLGWLVTAIMAISSIAALASLL